MSVWLMGSGPWLGRKVRQMDNEKIGLLRGCPYETKTYGNLRGALHRTCQCPIQRISFPDWKVIGISKWLSRCIHLFSWVQWGSCSNTEMATYSSCTPRGTKCQPELSCLPARKTETTGSCGAHSQREDSWAQLASGLYWAIARSARSL